MTGAEPEEQLADFPPMGSLATRMLVEPDVGNERLQWQPRGARAGDSAPPPPPSEPERVLSFVFHERPVSSVDGTPGVDSMDIG